MEAIKKHLESRLKHASKRASEVRLAHGDEPSKTHSYYGGWSFGYWEGKEAAYQDLLDKLEAEEVISCVSSVQVKKSLSGNPNSWNV